MNKTLKYILISLSYVLVSFVSSLLGNNRFDKNAPKALWQPPSYVFGIVWPFLYICLFTMNYLMLSYADITTSLKNIIANDTLIEAALQGLWLYNFRYSNTFPRQYFISMIILCALALFSFYRMHMFFTTNRSTLFYYALLYVPYFLWINLANILNIQLFFGITK